MHLGLLALVLEDFKITDSPVRRGLKAVEHFSWQDEGGKRIQTYVSPIWDTAFITIFLCDAGISSLHPSIFNTISWLQGDWHIYSPRTTSSGFCFEYHNACYPDVDDTAAVILAFLDQNPQSASSSEVLQATEWILGMQNPDGGWAAFDKDNDRLFITRIPFSDMKSLCDSSTADITGRMLEAFGLLAFCAQKDSVSPLLLGRLQVACDKAVGFLAANQEHNGSWCGRWGVHYVYGTSNVLCGLAYHRNDPRMKSMVLSAVLWLRKVQNVDDGWGEGVDTYQFPGRAGRGLSTASQTTWGLMGLMASEGIDSGDEAVRRGIQWLVRQQRIERCATESEPKQGCDEMGIWHQEQYTGTGFPGHFYLGYDLYRHYFPLMALGRYVQGLKKR